MHSLPFRLVLAVLGLLLAYKLAYAQEAQQPLSCSQTVGASAAPVPFTTGPPAPKVQLSICNAHGTNTLGVNWTRGTASIGAAGTLTLNPGGCISWGPLGIPATVSVIGSGGGTTTACGYN